MQKIKWIVVAVVISICGVLMLTKPAYASVKDYKIGGRKYQSRFVKVIKNVLSSGQVKYPVLKTNLTMADHRKMSTKKLFSITSQILICVPRNHWF